MLSQNDIQLLIEGCRKAAQSGLGNGTKATLQDLTLDFLSPPMDFLGLTNNPAIFVSDETYHFLAKFHKNWIADHTIAVKKNLLELPPMNVIGIIVHETGHAFNVAAKIPNTEANAYIFEIEVLSRWLREESPLLYGCTEEQLKQYFTERLEEYHLSTHGNSYLTLLVQAIESGKIPEFDDEKISSTEPPIQKFNPDAPGVLQTLFRWGSNSSLGFFSKNTTRRLLEEVECEVLSSTPTDSLVATERTNEI